MKKPLVALAVLAASGSAFAQASSVTLYGRLDGAVVNVDKANTANQSLTAVGDSTVATSIWGMRGSEDLGGGMRGVFNVEGDVSVTNGAASAAGLFRRGAFVGVSGGFGELTVGLRINPLIVTWAGAQVMTSNSVFVTSAAAAGFADFFTKNAVTYTAPKLGPATVQVQRGLGNVAGGDSKGAVTALSAFAPLPGGIELRAAFQQREFGGTAGTSANDAGGDKETSLFGIKGTFGPTTLAVNYLKNEVKNATNTALTTKVDLVQVAGSYALSKQMQVGASYTQYDGKLTGQGKTTLTNLQGRYILSPRTFTYLQVGMADNATVGIAVSPVWSVVGGVAGRSQQAVGLGAVHSF